MQAYKQEEVFAAKLDVLFFSFINKQTNKQTKREI